MSDTTQAGAEHLAVAARFAAATARADDDALLDVYEPDAQIWHNTDGTAQTPRENVALSRWVRARIPDLAFTEVHHVATADGFVQRHRMTGTAPGGPVDLRTCLVAVVSANGRISRLEEYLDSAALAALRRRH